MANPRYNTQVTQPRGSSARVGKMGGGMMRPMYKKGGRVKKMGGGRIAGAARRAQEHGYYTPDMGMKGGRMYRDGGKVKKPKVKKIAIGMGKAKDYPGIKKIIEMNKKGKKRFKDGGSALKAVDKSKNPGLAKLPTQVRNKMGYMKDGGKVKTPGGFKSTQQKGNIVKGKLKSQKELKKITSSDAYKKAGYHKKTEMLNRATHKEGGKVKKSDKGAINPGEKDEERKRAFDKKQQKEAARIEMIYKLGKRKKGGKYTRPAPGASKATDTESALNTFEVQKMFDKDQKEGKGPGIDLISDRRLARKEGSMRTGGLTGGQKN